MSTYEKSQRFNTVKEQMKHLKEKYKDRKKVKETKK
jgi:hypothetical protein|tara:strand:+ start:280 stop:387 length:108 start_codon:yes stop_codon:yes gene_type:complete